MTNIGASNRLLRQYLAKGADLRTFTQAELDTIAAELNNRPRLVHGYRSATQVWNGLRTPPDDGRRAGCT